MVHTGNTPTDITAYDEVIAWTELTLNPPPFETDYVEKIVNMPAATIGQSVHLAFVMNGDNGDRWLVDNVQVLGECLPPTDLSVGNIGLFTAELTWDTPEGTDTWEIEVLPEGDVTAGAGILYNGALPYIATATATGEPFTPGTGYRYYVRTVCDDGGTSDWVTGGNFSTIAYGDSCDDPIAVNTLPYFDAGNTADHADAYNGIAGTGCNITTQDPYLEGNDVVYSYTAGFTGNVDIELIGNEGYSGIFIYDECANIGVNCLNGGISSSLGTPVYINSFPVTAGEDYYIVVSSSHLNLTTEYALLIQQVSCQEPVALAPGDISMTSAELNWTNPTGATSWQLVVQQPGEGVPQGYGSNVTTNTDVPVTSEFDGTALEAATAYEYWVRADCGNGTFSTWGGPYIFHTSQCAISDQCAHTFTMWSLTNGLWNGYTMDVVQAGVVVATLTGPAVAGSGPVTQTVQLCDGLPYQLFWNNNGVIPSVVGVSASNAFGQQYFVKAPGQGTPGTILFSTAVLECEDPLCLPPTGLGVANINTATVDLSWSGNATGSWEYYIVASGGAAPTTTSTGVETTANPAVGSSLLANGGTLQASTAYQYYVRELCDNAVTDESTWAGPFAFTTAACNLDDQCGYTFVMSAMWAAGWSGGTMAVKQNGTTVAILGPTFTTGATQSVTIPLCDDMPFEVQWLTGGSWSSQMGLKIINSYEQQVFNLPYFSAGLGTTIFTTTNDCDHPACIVPAGLYTENPTVNSIDLGWGGPATGNWEYYIVEEGQPAPGSATPGTATAVNPTIGVPLPTPGTNYQFYVRLACNGGTFTAWAGPYDFYSEACVDEDKCIYKFELLSQNGYGWEGNTMTVLQNGVPVATLGQTPFTGYSYIEEVALCPNTEIEVFWEYTGDASYEKGLVIYTPWMYDIYTLEYNTQWQGTTIFTGTISCDPPACLKPTELEATNITSSQVTLGWEPGGSEAEWAVWIVPIGSAEPAPDSEPTFTTTQNPVIYGNDPGETLTSGVAYEFYVMSMCGADGNSIVSDKDQFATPVLNTDCESAFELPVNPGADCIQIVTASFEGAPAGSVVPSCMTEMTEELAAVTWFSFEATSTMHSIGTSNYYGTAIWPYIAVYEGDCDGGLTEILCTQTREDVLQGLIPGNTYYVMMYNLVAPTDASSFDICVRTAEPFLYVSDTDYTVPELIQDVFIGSECAYIDNIEWVSGEADGVNGIGYFTENGSGFTFPAGIVLVSGAAEEIPGPNSEGGLFSSWENEEEEEELQNIIGLWPPDAHGGTSIKFDFAPMQEIPSGVPLFKFIFASDEYGNPDYECVFSDVFAFILTDLETGEAINLAVLPTGEPILVTTIHPDNGVCGAYNADYFGQYNSILAPINMNGQTIPMDALTPYALQANHSYRMHMIVANQLDNLLSSAVFLLEGSLNLGAVPLGADLTVAAGNALCQGETTTIQSGLDPALHTFIWYRDGELIEGQTAADLVVDEPGTYLLNAPATGTECVREGEVLIEFYPVIEEITTLPVDLTACSETGFAEFNLENNTPVILAGLTAADYVVTYHASEEDAQNDTGSLPSLYTNTVAWSQPIWVRIENTATGCHGFQESFGLVIQQVAISGDVTICEGTLTTITTTLTGGAETPVYSWKHDGEPVAGALAELSVNESGIYEVTVDNDGCILTASATVTVNALPAVDEPEAVTACDQYILPELVNGRYFTASQGGGSELLAGAVINSSQTIYVFAESGTVPNCTNEHSFTVTIVPTPEFNIGGPYVFCDPADATVSVDPDNFDLADATFAWKVNDVASTETGSSIQGTEFGTYEVTVTVNGCTATQSIAVTETNVEVALTPAFSLCEGATGTITAEVTPTGTAISYSWTKDGEPLTDIDGQIEVAETGEYEVTINRGGCIRTAATTVTVVPLPVVEQKPDVYSCSAYTLPALTDNNDYFTGTGGSGALLVEGDVITATQTIYIYAQNDTEPFCTNESSFTITVRSPEFSLGGPYVFCDPTDAIVSVSPENFDLADAAYAWTVNGVASGETGSSITGTAFGIYEVTVTLNGCPVTKSIAVTESDTEIAVTITGECIDDVYTLVASDLNGSFEPSTATYAWTGPNGYTAATQAITPEVTGSYTIVVATPENCTGTAAFDITSTLCFIQRGISPNNDGDNDVFDLTDLDVENISIFNRYGQQLYTRKNYTSEWNGQADNGDELPAGTYFYSIERRNGEQITGWVYINRGI